jgi:hypothetical protein
MGEEFYDRYGVEAMRYCDGTFSYGCFHGLTVSAILDKGLEVIQDLDKKCEQHLPNNLSCQHGIGHGVLEFVGHKNLNTALNYCSRLSWKGSLLGCQDGVFMEYNFPVIDSGSSDIKTKLREYNNDPYGLCGKVIPKFKRACYYELPRWWLGAFEFDVDKLGELCAAIEDDANRKSCYIGMGMSITGPVNYNSNKIIKTCNMIQKSDDRKLCLYSAVWSMPEVQKKTAGAQICRTFSPKEAEECLKSDWILNEIYN